MPIGKGNVVSIQTMEPVETDIAAKLRELANDVESGDMPASRMVVVFQKPNGNIVWRIGGFINGADACGMLQWAQMDIFDHSREID